MPLLSSSPPPRIHTHTHKSPRTVRQSKARKRKSRNMTLAMMSLGCSLGSLNSIGYEVNISSLFHLHPLSVWMVLPSTEFARPWVSSRTPPSLLHSGPNMPLALIEPPELSLTFCILPHSGYLMVFLDAASPPLQSIFHTVAKVVFLEHISERTVLLKIPQELPKVTRLLPWHLNSSWPTFSFSLLISYLWPISWPSQTPWSSTGVPTSLICGLCPRCSLFTAAWLTPTYSSRLGSSHHFSRKLLPAHGWCLIHFFWIKE